MKQRSKFKPKEKQKKPLVNNSIRANKVRLIDETGEQLGVLSLTEAIEKAQNANLDLIQVTEKIDPPVCKIMDYGKYLYRLKKKERSVKHHKGGELKGVRLTFNISDHDLETRAKQAEKFLKKGNRIMIEMKLRGRERAHKDFAEGKVTKFVDILSKSVEIKIERELKKQPRGLTMIIAKK